VQRFQRHQDTNTLWRRNAPGIKSHSSETSATVVRPEIFSSGKIENRRHVSVVQDSRRRSGVFVLIGRYSTEIMRPALGLSLICIERFHKFSQPRLQSRQTGSYLLIGIPPCLTGFHVADALPLESREDSASR